jgi:hypothetical protein
LEEVDKITYSVIETAEALVCQVTSAIEKLQDKGCQVIKQTKQSIFPIIMEALTSLNASIRGTISS